MGEILKIEDILLPISILLTENKQLLTSLDSAIGDGDHGVTMEKIATVIKKKITEKDENESTKNILETLSWDMMNISGGSAGPLLGSYFEGLSEGIEENENLTPEVLKRMFISAYDSFYNISGAKPGEKTMMDAIHPATEVIRNSTGSIAEVFQNAAIAAKKGAENTANMIAKYGRARSIKEKSLGHKDPGAVSFSLLFKAIASALKGGD